MRKKLWSALLALVLAAMLPCAAFAAQGDANIARGSDLLGTYGDGVRNGCVLGDTLYLCGSKHLFSYRVGEADVTAIELEIPEAEADERRDLERVFSDGEGLWALCARYEFDGEIYALDDMEVWSVELDGERATFGEMLEDADFDDFVDGYFSEDGFVGMINDACAVDGWLMINMFNIDGYTQVYALNLESGEGYYIDGPENVSSIMPYGDGQLLIENGNFEDWAIELYAYDPEEDEAELICEPIPMDDDFSGNFTSLAYSVESGRLFYLGDGYVMAVEDFDISTAEPVAELSANIFGEGGGRGLMLPGDYFVTVSSEVTTIRATNPDGAAAKQLVIDGATTEEAINAAYAKFTNTHGDVSVVLSNSYHEGSELIEAMMYQDDSIDIYALPVNSSGFDALYSRGFMMELDDEALTSAVARMYPAFQDALMLDGKLIAVPAVVFGTTQGLDYEAFEEIGIAREDVPTSWREFLEMLPELADALPEDDSVRIFSSFETQQSLRQSLFTQILNSWRNQAAAAGEALTYDDPELASLLETLMDVDFDALDVAEESDDSGFVEFDSNTRVLFTDSTGCALGNMWGNWSPVPLRAREDLDACIPLGVGAVFINPYSKNPEEAQEFLVEVVNNLNEATLYNLCDEYSEPVRDPQSLKDIEDARGQIEEMKKKLELVDPVDVPAVKEEIASAEERLAEMEENTWLISAEDIEWYRGHAAQLTAERYNYLNATDEDGELSDLIQQVMAGRMQVSNFLKEIDRKVRMRATEGN